MYRKWWRQRITQVYCQKLLNHITHLIRLGVKRLFRNMFPLCIVSVGLSIEIQIVHELTNAKAAPLYVWWYINLYSSSLAACSAAASALMS
jgi:hypothetical protein